MWIHGKTHSNHVKHLNFRGGGVLKNRLFLVCALVETVPGQPFWCYIQLANKNNRYTHAFSQQRGRVSISTNAVLVHCMQTIILKQVLIKHSKFKACNMFTSWWKTRWTQAVDNKSLSARLGIKQSAPLRFASDDPWHEIRIWNVEVKWSRHVLQCASMILWVLHVTKLKLFVCFLIKAMDKMGKMLLRVAVSGHLWRRAPDSQRCCLSCARLSCFVNFFFFLFNFSSWHQQFVGLLASVSIG